MSIDSKMIWLKIERRRLSFNERASNIMRRALNEQFRQFQRQCIQQGRLTIDCVDVINELPIRDAMNKLYVMIGLSFAASVSIPKKLNHNLQSTILGWVNLNVAERIVGITAATKIKIKGLVSKWIELQPSNIEREIRNEWNTISRVRATTIARTEVVSASNMGSIMGAEEQAAQFGVDLDKFWLATQDGRTRDAHNIANGQSRKIKQAFVVDGELLDFPGDPKGSPGNVINCRCAVTYEAV